MKIKLNPPGNVDRLHLLKAAQGVTFSNLRYINYTRLKIIDSYWASKLYRVHSFDNRLMPFKDPTQQLFDPAMVEIILTSSEIGL